MMGLKTSATNRLIDEGSSCFNNLGAKYDALGVSGPPFNQNLGQNEFNKDRKQEPEGHQKMVIAITIFLVVQR